jgi:heme/copper-type cytochrome/quinol oxidase subunit 2
MNTAGRLANSAVQKLTPECPNLARAASLTSWISIIVSVVLIVMLAFLILYNQYKKVTSTDSETQKENEENKKKTLQFVVYGSTITAVIGLLVNVWSRWGVVKVITTCVQ